MHRYRLSRASTSHFRSHIELDSKVDERHIAVQMMVLQYCGTPSVSPSSLCVIVRGRTGGRRGFQPVLSNRAGRAQRVESNIMRQTIIEDGIRADGRGTTDVRPIWSRAGVLPRTHGSALFTRGETQVAAAFKRVYSRLCSQF